MGKDKGHQALLIYFSARFYFIAQSRKIYWIVIIYWEVCSKINSINIHDSLRIVFLCRLFIISFRTLILGRFLPDLPSNRCTKSFCFVFFDFLQNSHASLNILNTPIKRSPSKNGLEVKEYSKSVVSK